MPNPLGNYDLPKEPEWLLLAQAGIKTTTEIPKIIPPLPEGDTRDLKVWKEYWKNHDAKIRKDERERALMELKTEFLKYVHPDSDAGKVMKTLIKHRITEQP